MKNNNLKAIIVTIIGALMLAGVMFYAINKDKETPKYFTYYKENAAEKIYAHITEKNFEDDYPKSIDELIDFHNEILLMIYGNMLINNEKLEEIITIERKLYSEELLSKNTLKEQYDNVVENLKEINEKEIYTIGIKRVSILENENGASVKVNQFVSKIGLVEWNYYLKKDKNEQWKINSWEISKEKEITD